VFWLLVGVCDRYDIINQYHTSKYKIIITIFKKLSYILDTILSVLFFFLNWCVSELYTVVFCS